jgi:hypothetical protein
MLNDVFNDLARDPSFFPLAAIFVVIFFARMIGQSRRF